MPATNDSDADPSLRVNMLNTPDGGVTLTVTMPPPPRPTRGVTDGKDPPAQPASPLFVIINVGLGAVPPTPAIEFARGSVTDGKDPPAQPAKPVRGVITEGKDPPAQPKNLARRATKLGTAPPAPTIAPAQLVAPQTVSGATKKTTAGTRNRSSRK